MEGKKFEKKIRDWATALGFRLPDGSAPPQNYFALLTATPHRRQLWEVLVESIQPRKKVEHMRKQILVLNLKEGKKNVKNFDVKQITNRTDLWMKQNLLECEFKEKRKELVEHEKNILAKASDLLFEICKLAELENQCEKYKEKVLVLKILSKREKKLVEELEKLLLKIVGVSNKGIFLKRHCQNNIEDKIQKLQEEFSSTESCKSSIETCLDCNSLNKIRELCESGITEEYLWGEVVKCKSLMLEKFSKFVEELSQTQKSIISKEEAETEKTLKSSIIGLKRRITEKALQVMLSETEGRLLNSEIEKLFGKIEKLVWKNTEDASLNENVSFLAQDETNASFLGKDESLVKLRNYVNQVGLISYKEFLNSELARLENEHSQKLEVWKEQKDVEKEFNQTLKSHESISDEIALLKSEQEEQERKIVEYHEKVKVLSELIGEEIKKPDYVSKVEETVGKLKTSFEKQIELFIETPLEAFRTVQTSSGRKAFECESLSHCLNNYGGEFKQFFSSMLISPYQDFESMLRIITKRKKLVESLKQIISERGRLSDSQKKFFAELTSIKYDSQLCEKNFKDSDGILWNVLFKGEGLSSDIEFTQKILKNWVDQPYRLMIEDTETVEGMTLKEYEELYKKAKKGVE